MEKLKNLIQKDKNLEFVKKLHKKYEKATVFLVGGAVRDWLRESQFSRNKKYLTSNNQYQITDYDFVVENIKKDELEKFLKTQGTVKDVESRAFGVFKFIPNKKQSEPFDVAVPRLDRWTGEGYKDIEVEMENVKIKDDLSRRDFTVNAMAISLRTYELLDLFKGRNDLKDKLIRAVGKPEDRFMEDPSRILRGIRFGVQLDFKIEKDTLEAMKNLAGEVRQRLPQSPEAEKLGKPKAEKPKYRVAEEVIAKEFLKAFDKDSERTIRLWDKVGLLKLLLPEIEAMKGIEQPKNFHSEGDVYVHTLLALRKFKEYEGQSAKGKTQSKILNIKHQMPDSINLKLAVLLHDVGKPPTYKSAKETGDRIRFHEHDVVGAKMAKRLIERLKLTVFPKEDRLHVDKERVSWLVRKHMILVYADPEKMRLTKLEKYFFNPDGRSRELLALARIDISATIPPSGKPDFSTYHAFLKKMEKVRKQVETRREEEKLPPPLVNGHDVIKILKIKPGPKVGAVLSEIRELQLLGKLKTKKEAIKKIKNLHR